MTLGAITLRDGLESNGNDRLLCYGSCGVDTDLLSPSAVEVYIWITTRSVRGTFCFSVSIPLTDSTRSSLPSYTLSQEELWRAVLKISHVRSCIAYGTLCDEAPDPSEKSNEEGVPSSDERCFKLLEAARRILVADTTRQPDSYCLLLVAPALRTHFLHLIQFHHLSQSAVFP